MNEEMKNLQDELRNEVKRWAKNDKKGYEYWNSEAMDFIFGRGLKLMEQAYKLGAKDAIEAVKIEEIGVAKGCHHSSLGSASTLVGDRCKVCGKTTKEMDDLINGY